MTGTLYIISAPSGCGKTSLVNTLLKSVDQLQVSISYTTRPARSNEFSGINYHFVEEAKFKQLIKEETFLEYAKVFGYYYGTPIAWVKKQLAQGLNVILEIDWQGARQIKQKLPNSISIFLIPPSWEALKIRLKQRGQDSQAIIEQRMNQAKLEMSHYNEYDYLIINSNFEQAVEDCKAIIRAHYLKQSTQAKILHPILETLTK